MFTIVVGLGCESASDEPIDDCPSGPCASVLEGDVAASGEPRVDGYLKATLQLARTAAVLEQNFDANLRALEQAYAVDSQTDTLERIRAVTRAIRSDAIESTVEGLESLYVPSACSANVSIAAEVSVQCGEGVDCELSGPPDTSRFECEGVCYGACDGACDPEGDTVCVESGSAVTCDGTCRGICFEETSTRCSKACFGSCDGWCATTLSDGSCAGACDGECHGVCEVAALAECSGWCSGQCETAPNGGTCESPALERCGGACLGNCLGGCAGEVHLASGLERCRASAVRACEALGSLVSAISMSCAMPELDYRYVIASWEEPASRVGFEQRVSVLRSVGPAILRDYALYRALFTGKLEAGGEIVPPVATLRERLDVLVQQLFSGDNDFDIALAQILCAPGAVEEASELLDHLAGKASAGLEVQQELVSTLVEPRIHL